MNLLHRRGWLLLGTAALFGGGMLGVACGPNKPNFDGGVDSGNDGTLGDSGQDGAKPDGGGSDGSPGSCEAGIGGSCDIVAQSCGSGKECAVVKLADGGYETQCVTNSTGSIKEGYACTQSGNNNPCVAGLECISNRCAKHCCIGDDSVCGQSQPEHNAGHCDLNITVNGTDTAYSVCTYSTSCEPFQLQACTSSQTCIVKDVNGTSSCSDYASADGGLNEKATCQYLNDCKDGLGCYGNLDGGSGSFCQWNCYVPPGPFDAGITSLGAGKGGCPVGESCKPINWGGQLPTWFGICAK